MIYRSEHLTDFTQKLIQTADLMVYTGEHLTDFTHELTQTADFKGLHR